MAVKILLVEDDTTLSEIYQARLQAEGYEILSAPDGETALAIAVKEHPELIISDVMMPKISGFDMLDILRGTDGIKDTKVIMMSALGQAEDKARAEKLGANRYLVKSQVTLEDVIKAVKEVLTGESAVAAELEVPAAEEKPAEAPADNSGAAAAPPAEPTSTPDTVETSPPAAVTAAPAAEPATASAPTQIPVASTPPPAAAPAVVAETTPTTAAPAPAVPETAPAPAPAASIPASTPAPTPPAAEPAVPATPVTIPVSTTPTPASPEPSVVTAPAPPPATPALETTPTTAAPQVPTVAPAAAASTVPPTTPPATPAVSAPVASATTTITVETPAEPAIEAAAESTKDEDQDVLNQIQSFVDEQEPEGEDTSPNPDSAAPATPAAETPEAKLSEAAEPAPVKPEGAKPADSTAAPASSEPKDTDTKGDENENESEDEKSSSAGSDEGPKQVSVLHQKVIEPPKSLSPRNNLNELAASAEADRSAADSGLNTLPDHQPGSTIEPASSQDEDSPNPSSISL